MTEWNGDAVMDEIKRAAAEGLLAAATLYTDQLRLKVSVANPLVIGPRGGRTYPTPSLPGQYPRLRTGKGQKAIAMGANGKVFDGNRAPALRDVLDGGMVVKAGYVEGDHHLLALEFAQNRKGLLDLLEEMKPQLAALATAEFKDER